MLKIRRPLGRLIFNMGIAIPGKTVFLIETAPCVWVMDVYGYVWIKGHWMREVTANECPIDKGKLHTLGMRPPLWVFLPVVKYLKSANIPIIIDDFLIFPCHFHYFSQIWFYSMTWFRIIKSIKTQILLNCKMKIMKNTGVCISSGLYLLKYISTDSVNLNPPDTTNSKQPFTKSPKIVFSW